MTNYSIAVNPQFNSIEISFNEKPSEQIREALKALKFRWHSVKRIWYGYSTEAEAREAIEGKATQDKASKPAQKAEKAPAVNKYGVQVGDIFRATWGYEQTNNDFFQVVELVGTSSVRVREVYPEITESKAVNWGSEDRTYKISRDILPPADRSVFIKDQQRGDLKRLTSHAADGASNPQFKLSSFADAWLVPEGSCVAYESWYY